MFKRSLAVITALLGAGMSWARPHINAAVPVPGVGVDPAKATYRRKSYNTVAGQKRTAIKAKNRNRNKAAHRG